MLAKSFTESFTNWYNSLSDSEKSLLKNDKLDILIVEILNEQLNKGKLKIEVSNIKLVNSKIDEKDNNKYIAKIEGYIKLC